MRWLASSPDMIKTEKAEVPDTAKQEEYDTNGLGVLIHGVLELSPAYDPARDSGWDGAQDSPWSLSLPGQETATPPPKLEPVAKEEMDEAMASTGEKDRVP